MKRRSAFARIGTAHACPIVLFLFPLMIWGCSLPEVGRDRDSGGAGPDTATFSGPLPYRSLMPLSLIFPHPLPDRAAVMPWGGIEAEVRSDYGTIFVDDRRGAERIVVDGEFSRSSLTVRAGVGGRTEIAMEIPFLHYASGRFDDFIDGWHSVFGLSPGHRDEAPEDRFGVNYLNGRGSFFTADEDGFHLADIPVTVKVGLLDPEEEALGVALRALVEIPAGDDRKGFGSGKVDGGAGILLEKRLDELALYLSADHVFRSSPESFDGIRAAHTTHASLAAEYLVDEDLALVAQTDFQTKPLDGGRLGEFGDPQWSGILGAVFSLGESTRVRLTMAEGFTTESAPDFVVSAGLILGF